MPAVFVSGLFSSSKVNALAVSLRWIPWCAVLGHNDRHDRLAQLSKVAGLSESHFCRTFKEVTTLTVTEYTTYARISWARKELLRPSPTSPFRSASNRYPCSTVPFPKLWAALRANFEKQSSARLQLAPRKHHFFFFARSLWCSCATLPM